MSEGASILSRFFFSSVAARWESGKRLAIRKPVGAIGGVLLGATVVVALLAPWVAPQDPRTANAWERLQPPSSRYILGTDELGRDVLSRVIYGTRISLYVGLAATVIGTGAGALLGVVSAYFRLLDMVIQRVMDVLQVFPALILALVIVAVLGPSAENVVVAVAVPFLPRANRVVRSAALSVQERPFVDAARAIGCSDLRIIFRHILPNCVAPYLVLATALLGNAIVAEASLSFLGLGIPPPAPSWGSSLFAATHFFDTGPWMLVSPATALCLVIFSINFLGDALRDLWDPRLR